MKTLYFSIFLILLNQTTQAQCNSALIYNNDSTHAVCFETTTNTRRVVTNNIPDHIYGPFGGPNTIAAQDFEYFMCLYPDLASVITPLSEDTTSQSCGGGIVFGISHQGVLYSPFAILNVFLVYVLTLVLVFSPNLYLCLTLTRSLTLTPT